MSAPVVLVVDGDADARAETASGVGDRTGLGVATAGSVAAAAAAVDEHPIECVVTSYDLPDGTGFEVVDAVRAARPDAGCILFTDRAPGEVPTAEAPRVAEFLFRDLTTLDRLADLVGTTVSARSQTAYPLPGNESERLAALASFDFDSERLRTALDRVASLAGEHFDVPTATVNMIDRHTQEFVGCYGAQWAPTPRGESICTHAIVDDDPVTVIEDTAADPRFRDNETLTDLDIRFYAGADLTTADGATLGTLCVYDDDPRTFSEADRRYLATLADVALDYLELHRELREAVEPGPGAADDGGQR
jgi:GAF domain-containing protein